MGLWRALLLPRVRPTLWPFVRPVQSAPSPVALSWQRSRAIFGGQTRLAGSAPHAGTPHRTLFGWLQGAKIPPVARVGKGGDPYAWLQHGDEREIKAHLEAENQYAKWALKPVKKLEREVFAAMSGRLDDQEHGDPEKIEKWYYYMRTREGSAFPVYCRREKMNGGVEEVLLDQDELASRVPYLMVPQCKISPCHTKLAYTADTTGDERYTGFIKDVRTGEILCEVPDVTTLEWSTDGIPPTARPPPPPLSTSPPHTQTCTHTHTRKHTHILTHIHTNTRKHTHTYTHTHTRTHTHTHTYTQITRTHMNTGKTILYTQPDHHRRPYRVWRRFVRGDPCDELILEVPPLAFSKLTTYMRIHRLREL